MMIHRQFSETASMDQRSGYNELMNELEIVRYSHIDGARMFFNRVNYRTNHFHEEWEILWVIEEPLVVGTSREKIEMQPGDIIVFPPYSNHDLTAVIPITI